MGTRKWQETRQILTIPIRTQRGCGERYEHGFTVLYMKDETWRDGYTAWFWFGKSKK